MCRFVRLVIDRENSYFENTQYISQVMFLYLRYSKFIKDDYAPADSYENMLNFIEKCGMFFWVILADDGEFAGFVFLDNLIGNEEKLHSAEISTCFEKKFWGRFTKEAAKQFIQYCFETLGLCKIKALIYPFNFRVKTLLKDSGFTKECVLKGETLKNNTMQDIEVYSIFAQMKGLNYENRN